MGDCAGNDINGVKGTIAECAAQCNAVPECVGFGHIVAGKRAWPHAPCILKRKLCAKPVAVAGLSITTFFKAASEGRLVWSIIMVIQCAVVVKPDDFWLKVSL